METQTDRAGRELGAQTVQGAGGSPEKRFPSGPSPLFRLTLFRLVHVLFLTGLVPSGGTKYRAGKPGPLPCDALSMCTPCPLQSP